MISFLIKKAPHEPCNAYVSCVRFCPLRIELTLRRAIDIGCRNAAITSAWPNASPPRAYRALIIGLENGSIREPFVSATQRLRGLQTV